jgi:hypothetical protein
MSDERKSFEFYVGGIEDGCIEVLQAAVGGADGYLNEIGTYSGELDEKTLKAFIDELAPRFPLMLVAYGEGADVLMPAISSAFGQPRIFRHDCTFGVVCCDNDARGETERRRGVEGAAGSPGVIKMLSDARDALGGLQLWKAGDDFEYGIAEYGSAEPGAPGKELLTFDPLTIAGVRYLARLPGMTAYIQDFETYFKWEEPDRRGKGTKVTNLDFEAQTTNQPGKPGALPGVIVK